MWLISRISLFFLWPVVVLAIPQGQGILAGLRSFVSGVTSNLKLDFLDDFDVPDSMVPEEFKIIKFGLCGADIPTKSCTCEEGAEVVEMTFPKAASTSITFKELKTIFGKCRPT